jgi:alanine racemase
VIRRSVAEVSLRAITHNLQTVQKIVKNRPVIAVVKADAYGHGAVEVSRQLLKEGIPCLAVAYTGEAKELREAGIDAPVIVLFDCGDIRDYFDLDLIPVVYTLDTASALSREAGKRGTVKKVHVKIDTGMGRLGLNGNCAVEDLTKISEMPGVEITGLLSHFSEADLLDRSYARLQLERFNAIREAVSGKLKRKILSHMANSAAVLAFEDAHLDAVRPGLILYGHLPIIQGSSSPAFDDIDLIPAMTVKTSLLCIRDVPSGTPISYGRTFVTKRQSRIGVIAIGYADGYSRFFSNKAEMLVGGKRAPVVGRVCMDLTMVDLTDVTEAEENDEAVILGRQGNELITADELASKANTVSYEILTSLGSQSKRVYV